MRPGKEAMVWPERLKIPRSADASFWHAPCGCLPRKAMTTCWFVRSRGRRAWHRGSRTTISIPSRRSLMRRLRSTHASARNGSARFLPTALSRWMSSLIWPSTWELRGKRFRMPISSMRASTVRFTSGSLGICEAVRPSLTAALERDAATRGMQAPDAEMLAGMLVYGSIGLASDGHELGEQTRRAARRYVAALMKEFRHIGERKG